MATNIGSMLINEKLDGTNYDLWSLKVQLLSNNGDMVELLTGSMFAPVEQDEHGNDVTASEQYKETLKAYKTWFKRDRSARYTLLSCMHDDLLGEFEGCPTAKDMWDRIKIRFGQTSATRLRTLRPKWMQFQLNAGRPMTEQLRALSGIVRDQGCWPRHT